MPRVTITHAAGPTSTMTAKVRVGWPRWLSKLSVRSAYDAFDLAMQLRAEIGEEKIASLSPEERALLDGQSARPPIQVAHRGRRKT
jgi:hypothetical protein